MPVANVRRRGTGSPGADAEPQALLEGRGGCSSSIVLM